MLFNDTFAGDFLQKGVPAKIPNSYLEEGIKYNSSILPSYFNFFPFAFKHVTQDIIFFPKLAKFTRSTKTKM